MIYIGTAGWTIPKQVANSFTGEGTHLERYAQILNCVEINSSFYKPHKPETYAKWAASVPENFRFSVKLERTFTQEARLKDISSKLDETLHGISHLGKKWSVLLVQLPPSLNFEVKVASKFFKRLRSIYEGGIAIEPRHKTWSTEEAVATLEDFRISKVLADPEPSYLSRAKRERLNDVLYYRMHGTPEIYKSKYASDIIERLSQKLSFSEAQNSWCIFDNTTFGYATENALELRGKILAP